jgi:hypothetical protein
MLRYDDLLDITVSLIPEWAPAREETDRWVATARASRTDPDDTEEDLGPHGYFGLSFLPDLVFPLLSDAEHTFVPTIKLDLPEPGSAAALQLLGRIFDFVDRMLVEGDPLTRDLALSMVIEDLFSQARITRRALPHLKPAALAVVREHWRREAKDAYAVHD